MVTISKEANMNYLAKVVELKGIRKHNNADKLQIVSIDFQDVVTGMDAKDGDIYVYFPVECTINKDFLSYTNSFREKSLNADDTKVGFFEENSRVKAMRLRGEKSCGYIVPVDTVEQFTGIVIRDFVGEEFDTIGDTLMCKKYIPKNLKQDGSGNKLKQGKSPKESRLIEGQVHLHIDTANFRKNAHKINPKDIISVTYKTHGTSGWCSNVLTKRKLSWKEKFARFLGVKVQESEYDLIYGSRKVIKNSDVGGEKNHFYSTDIWKDVVDSFGLANLLPKGYSLYYEILGYTSEGGAIQKDYDYGCNIGENKVEVYRVTHTNPDGLVTELTYPQIVKFCEKLNMNPCYLFYYGYAGEMYPTLSVDSHWNENFLRQLEADYNEKDCFLCKNTVPEEGIVIRKEKLLECESYKLKSFAFLGMESKQLDSGEVSLEDEN